MAGPSSYLRSLEEMQAWLTEADLVHLVHIFLHNGYDSLSALSLANAAECKELEQLFPDATDRRAVRAAVRRLVDEGICAHRERAPTLHANSTQEPSAEPQRGALLFRSDTSAAFASRECCFQNGVLRVAGIHEPITLSLGVEFFKSDQGGIARLHTLHGGWCEFDVPATAVDAWRPVFEFLSRGCSIPRRSQVFTATPTHNASMVSSASSWMSFDGRRSQSATVCHMIEQRYLKILVAGCVFKKTKRTSTTRRCVWFDASLGKLMWGSTDQATVKGFLRTSRIRNITDGGSSQHRMLYVITDQRNLELEAADDETHGLWLQALRHLLVKQREWAAEWEALAADAQFMEQFQVHFERHRTTLTQGTLCKKYKRSSCVVRKIMATGDLSRLQWIDVEKNKVKGFVNMADVIGVGEQEAEGRRFTIECLDRQLILENADCRRTQAIADAVSFLVLYFDYIPLLTSCFPVSL